MAVDKIRLDELLNKEFLTVDEIAEILGVKKNTVLQRYAPQPDFPNRISLSRKIFWWKGSDMRKYYSLKQEKRPC